MADTLSADVIVVGAGVVAALTARKLALAGKSVVILEAGPMIERDQIVQNFRRSAWKDDADKPYPNSEFAPFPDFAPEDNGYLEQLGPYPYPAMYLRVVGGTTWHWAAQAWRLVPNDFRIRSAYDIGRDWPISYDDLEPFYHEAEVLWGVSGPDEMAQYSPRSKPFPMPPVALSFLSQTVVNRLKPKFEVLTNTTGRNSQPYDGRPQCCGNNNCMPICPIDAQYTGGSAVMQAQAAGVRVIPQAVVYKLDHDAQGRITALHYFDWDKQSHKAIAETYVLGANALEIPKILLMSASDRFPNGLANNHDQVGRNLMDHPSSKCTFLADEPVWAGRGPQSPISIQQMRDGDFRKDHAAFRLDFSNGSRVTAVTEQGIKQGLTGDALDRFIRERASREMTMKNVLEQLPDPENRVVLSKGRTDALGLPTPAITYSINDYVERGMDATQDIYRQIVELMGATEVRYTPKGQYSNNQHICGTLAMGDDEKTSVTDSVGRAHAHENLYMVSTGVMPTVATANSTLTASALGLRTAAAILGQV